MTLATCVSCGLPVLELEGQFAKLDSFYVANDVPLLATAGWWHLRCLADSPSAGDWYRARLRNFVEVRGYDVVAELATWTVARGNGEVLGFGESGELVSLSLAGPARRVAGGAIYPVVERMFTLEVDDHELIAAIQRSLTSTGTYSLGELLAGLKVLDRVVHPVSLEGSALHFVADFQAHWSRSAITARAEYGVFVPEELEAYVTAPAT